MAIPPIVGCDSPAADTYTTNVFNAAIIIIGLSKDVSGLYSAVVLDS